MEKLTTERFLKIALAYHERFADGEWLKLKEEQLARCKTIEEMNCWNDHILDELESG